jgi:type IV pilus assembly protein PilE
VEQVQSQAATSRGGRNACKASTVRTRSDARPPLGDGFTLIELMITVAVIAILAAIAIPAYGDYVRRSKITEAASSLSDMRNRLEQYFLDNRQFPVNCIPAATGPAPVGSIYLPGGTQYFTFTCAFPSATTYTVTATGIATKGMGNFAYTINEANARGTASLPSGWSGAGSSCWVTNKGGAC